MLTLLFIILLGILLTTILGFVLKVVFGVGKAAIAIAILPITIISSFSGLLPLVLIALIIMLIVSSSNRRQQ